MANVFGLRSAAGGVQPWSDTLAFGSNLKDYYESRGNATLVGTNEIATILDGPEKVVMYDDLTVGDGATATVLTASQRCKGLTVIVRGNLLVKNNATIKMTARGARVDRNDDPRFPFINFLIPNKNGLYSETMSRKAALELIAKLGLAPWDRGFWDGDGGLLGLNCSIAEVGATTLISVSGCAAGADGARASNNSTNGATGNAGTSGGFGSGGSGGAVAAGSVTWAGKSGGGCPYSGGSGSGGLEASGGFASVNALGKASSRYSGPGGGGGLLWINNNSCRYIEDVESSYGCGGAGNPPGNGVLGGTANGSSGTGGKLVIICYGNITVESGGKIESNGSAGGNAASQPGGGGSGGGHISLIYAGSYTNNGTVQCSGGAGGPAGSVAGGAGGAGSVVTKTFAQMGWA